MTVAIHANDFGAAQDLDSGGVHDPMGQITRHALAKIIAADEEEDLAHVLRKIDCRLAGRVAAAHQHDIRAAAHLRLVRCGGIVDTSAFESTTILNLEAAILRAGGDEQTFRDNIFSALRFKNGIHLVEGQLCYRRWNRYARAELIGLKNRAIGQFASGDTSRKSQVILDAHAAPRLTSWSGVFEHDR